MECFGIRVLAHKKKCRGNSNNLLPFRVFGTMLKKICGLRELGDAGLAAALGADFLGLILVPQSKRYIEPSHAGEIVARIRKDFPAVLTTAVIMDLPLDQTLSLARETRVDAIQLHGNEPPEIAQAIQQAGWLVIKAIPVGEGAPDHDWLHYPCDYRLADTYHKGASGGTGKLLDQRRIPPPSSRGPQPLLLAGGLNPENLEIALSNSPVQGVDVSSGVEQSAGKKCPEKLRKLFERLAEVESNQG